MSSIIAHRANSWNNPKNTKEALEFACNDDNTDIIEIDVWCTKDGEFVLRHDQNIIFTSNKFAKITDLTYSELKQIAFRSQRFDYLEYLYNTYRERNIPGCEKSYQLVKELKDKRGHICTLEQALEYLIPGKKMMVELKGGIKDYHDMENLYRLLTLLQGEKKDQLMIHGFDAELIDWFKNHDSNLKAGIGIGKDFSILEKPIMKKFEYVNFDIKHMSKNISQFKKYALSNPGIPIGIYKVDNVKELNLYSSLFDNIFSYENMPDVMTNCAEVAKNLVKKYPSFQRKTK